MTTTDAAPAVQIAAPPVPTTSTALAIPDAPRGAADANLATIAASDAGREKLVCNRLLVGDSLTRAKSDAVAEYTKMTGNHAEFMAYGTSALSGVNDIVEKLLNEVEPVKIEEVTKLMHGLNDEMRTIKRGYDVSDPKVRERYEKWKGGIMRFFGKARTMLEMLGEDIRSVEGQLDKVSGELMGREDMLVRNVVFYDELYDENEQEIGKLIYVIAVMELIRDQAARDAEAIVVGDANLGDRRGEQKAALAEFVQNMDIKIGEYKGRLWIAWSTSPQTRTMRTLNVGLAEKLNELINVTIPTMKATLVQWRMLVETSDAQKLGSAVAETSNEWLQQYARAGAEIVPRVADAINTPTLTAQTIAVMADSIVKQADGIIAAVQAGEKRRDEIDAAMISNKAVLADASARVSDAQIRTAIDSATKPVEIATAVPATA